LYSYFPPKFDAFFNKKGEVPANLKKTSTPPDAP